MKKKFNNLNIHNILILIGAICIFCQKKIKFINSKVIKKKSIDFTARENFYKNERSYKKAKISKIC